MASGSVLTTIGRLVSKWPRSHWTFPGTQETLTSKTLLRTIGDVQVYYNPSREARHPENSADMTANSVWFIRQP